MQPGTNKNYFNKVTPCITKIFSFFFVTTLASRLVFQLPDPECARFAEARLFNSHISLIFKKASAIMHRVAYILVKSHTDIILSMAKRRTTRVTGPGDCDYN